MFHNDFWVTKDTGFLNIGSWLGNQSNCKVTYLYFVKQTASCNLACISSQYADEIFEHKTFFNKISPGEATVFQSNCHLKSVNPLI